MQAVLVAVQVSIIATTLFSVGNPDTSTDDRTVRLMVGPARADMPGIPMGLWPGESEWMPGDAAPFYYLAASRISRAPEEAICSAPVSDEWGEEWEGFRSSFVWLELPLGRMPLDEIRECIRRLTELHGYKAFLSGSVRRQCTWTAEQIADSNLKVYSSEVADLMKLSQAVLVKARLHVADGDVAEAIDTIKPVLQLSRHLGDGPTSQFIRESYIAGSRVVNGIAEIIQIADSTNLYWDLAQVKTPFVDLRALMYEAETGLERLFPDMRELERGPVTQYRIDRLREEMRASWDDVGEYAIRDWPAETFYSEDMIDYGAAREALEQHGVCPLVIDQMPPDQVVILHALKQWRQAHARIAALVSLPWYEARAHLDDAVADVRRAAVALDRVLASGMAQYICLEVVDIESAVVFWRISVRLVDRRIAVLRVIEAIRSHVATHDGRLPESLDKIALPVPMDPMTGRMFVYERTDNGFVIDGRPQYSVTFTNE